MFFVVSFKFEQSSSMTVNVFVTWRSGGFWNTQLFVPTNGTLKILNFLLPRFAN